MARYLGPKCRLSRRAKTDLMLKSNIRPIESKCNIERTPGQHWQRRGRHSDYGDQLQMKQRVRDFYGVLEKQFRRDYDHAARQKGSTGYNLFVRLERRLCNVVYRMGFASTRAEARQLVSHKAINVNGYRINVPSYRLKPGDEIAVNDKAKQQLRVQAALDLAQQRDMPTWLDVNAKEFKGIYKNDPDVADVPQEFKMNLVVELYSK